MPTSSRPEVWISAGETSGDQRAAEFLDAFLSQRPAELFGIAGPMMTSKGVEPLTDIEQLGAIGIAEVVRTLPETLRILRRSVQLCRKRRPALAVLVDYGEFHMRLGSRLRKMGIPVFHLAPPKVWAWGSWRLRRLQRSADAVGVLFPFEGEFFEAAGFLTAVIGHPAAALLHTPRPDHPDKLLVLPGSRRSEVERHLPIMIEAARRLRSAVPLKPVLCRAQSLPNQLFDPVPTWLEIRTTEQASDLADGALAVAASGTVNLELAALGIPQVVGYRAHPVTEFTAKLLVNTRWLNPLNISAGRSIVTELTAEAMTPENLAGALAAAWTHRDTIGKISSQVMQTMDRPDGMAHAAEVAWRIAA